MEETNQEFVKINKLQNARDWSRWKFQIRVILNDLDIYGVVSGDYPKPILQARGEENLAQATARHEEDMKVWKKKDNKVQKYLSTTVGDQAILHIMNCDNAKDMWDKLHAVYEQKSQTRIHLTQQKFFAYEMEEGDNIASHISKLEDLAQQLKDLGSPIESSMLITKILMTLPSTYAHFHSAWESTAADKRTMENLTSRLLVEEARISAFEDRLDSTAFSARSSLQRKNFKSSQQKMTTGRCFKCDKSGHWKRDCPMLKKGWNW